MYAVKKIQYFIIRYSIIWHYEILYFYAHSILTDVDIHHLFRYFSDINSIRSKFRYYKCIVTLFRYPMPTAVGPVERLRWRIKSLLLYRTVSCVQTARTYSATNIEDLTEVLNHIKHKRPNCPIAGIGFSMGGYDNIVSSTHLCRGHLM